MTMQSIIGVRNGSNNSLTHTLLVPGAIKGEQRVVSFELWNQIPTGQTGLRIGDLKLGLRSVYGGDEMISGGYIWIKRITSPAGDPQTMTAGAQCDVGDFPAGTTILVEMKITIPEGSTLGSYVTMELYPTGGYIGESETDNTFSYYGTNAKYNDIVRYGCKVKTFTDQLESMRGLITFPPILLVFDPILDYTSANDYADKGIRFST